MDAQEPLRILIVEDDQYIAQIIKLAMHTLDIPYILDHAFSAEEALDLWHEQPYDLLLSDYNLRGINGLSLIKALKEQGFTIPTMLFTAYDTTQLRKAARAVGVDQYLPKPFLIEEFIQLTRELLIPSLVNEVGGTMVVVRA